MADFTSVMDKYDGVVPVPVFDIIKDLGIALSFDVLEDNVSGWIESQQDGGYKIVINDSHPMTRKRFTAAHELAHYLYHRDILGTGTGDTRAYRAERTPFANEAIRPRHERQANTFAANLLMPADVVTAMCANGVGDIDDLAERFGVSRDAMRIRVGG